MWNDPAGRRCAGCMVGVCVGGRVDRVAQQVWVVVVLPLGLCTVPARCVMAMVPLPPAAPGPDSAPSLSSSRWPRRELAEGSRANVPHPGAVRWVRGFPP